MYGFLFNNQTVATTAYQLLLLGEKIEATDSAVNDVIDIRHLVPRWIMDRNSEGNMVKFVQAYYDWLYNKADYELSTTTFHTVGLRRLIDLDETPVEFLKHFTYTYASGFPEHILGVTGPGGDNTSFVRDFIKGIRTNFYQKKSTEEAYQYFFQTLYGIDNPVDFFYPKKWILRLNGGRFGDWAIAPVCTEYNENGECISTNSGGTYDYSTDQYSTQNLGGSYLNGPYVIQDSYWYQNFSYLMKAGVDDDNIDFIDQDTGLPIYNDLMQSLLHPAGLKGFFEKTEIDYIPPDDYEGGVGVCEMPVLGNYFPYRMEDGPGSISQCIGCSGSGFTYAGYTGMASGLTVGILLVDNNQNGFTYGDGWATVGPGSISADFHIPTYHYPDWADGITGELVHRAPFREIYIGDFLYLCPIENSPNLGITGCTAYGDTDGGACWSS